MNTLEDKLAKLLALANGAATDGERQAALKRAALLAASGGIDLADVRSTEPFAPPHPEAFGELEHMILDASMRRLVVWRAMLAESCALITGCQAWWEDNANRLEAAGRAHALRPCSALYHVAVEATNEAAGVFIPVDTTSLRVGRNAFRMGFAMGLREAHINGPPLDHGEERALALRQAAEERTEETHQWLAEQGVQLEAASRGTSDAKCYGAGREAGRQMKRPGDRLGLGDGR